MAADGGTAQAAVVDVGASASVSEAAAASAGSGVRRLRADAALNRARILEAAEAVFAAQGVSAPIDDVAERAGVGVGTLYRHFATKEALFEAIVLARLEELQRVANASLEDGDPGETFYAFLREFARTVTTKHDLVDALSAAGIDIKSQCAGAMRTLQDDVDRMLVRAVDAGVVRDGVGTQEIIGLVVGVCQGADRSALDAESRERMLAVVFDGLHPQTAS
jgi:AcrR family transcriptional regulator